MEILINSGSAKVYMEGNFALFLVRYVRESCDKISETEYLVNKPYTRYLKEIHTKGC